MPRLVPVSVTDFPTNLHYEAFTRGITVPTKATLAKFGLTEVEWLLLLQRQDWRCAICRGTKKRWNTDHEHVLGWKKLPPTERKIYVRGVLCWFCNKFTAPSNMSVKQAEALAAYLRAYEERKAKALKEITP